MVKYYLGEGIAGHWQKTVNLLWNVPLVVLNLNRIFMRINPDLKDKHEVCLLDCACGTSDFAINFLKFRHADLDFVNYEIDCSDGNPEMIEHAKKKSEKERFPIEPKLVSWKDLSKVFSGDYDIVMLRGNSLPYVASWDNQEVDFEISPSKREEIEKELLNSFIAVHEQLAPGGIFYFDTANVFEREGEVLLHSSNVGGIKEEVIFDISYDAYLRKVVSKVRTDKEVDRRIYNGYRILPSKLDDLLQDAGFKFENIRHDVPIEGERIYSQWFVRK